MYTNIHRDTSSTGAYKKETGKYTCTNTQTGRVPKSQQTWTGPHIQILYTLHRPTRGAHTHRHTPVTSKDPPCRWTPRHLWAGRTIQYFTHSLQGGRRGILLWRTLLWSPLLAMLGVGCQALFGPGTEGGLD